jgi:hypothetical protein
MVSLRLEEAVVAVAQAGMVAMVVAAAETGVTIRALTESAARARMAALAH